MERGVLVAPVQTLMQRLPPTAFVEAQSLVLETGSHFSIDTQRLRLQRAGYRNVGTVAERGEYAVRGSLMDIFPMGSRLPLRIDLDDDEIDSLRTFDPDTQRTIERIDAVRILPAKEIPPRRHGHRTLSRTLAPHVRCGRAPMPSLPGRERWHRAPGRGVLPAVLLREHGHAVRLPAG